MLKTLKAYTLSKGHKEFFNTDEPLPYHVFKTNLFNYTEKTGTNIKFRNKDTIFHLDVEKITERRNEILGDYIEYIDPTKIVNNVTTPRPLLESAKITTLKESVERYGVVSPILVYTLPICDSWWRRRKDQYSPGFYAVAEGRHRALVTELLNYTKPIPAFVIIPIGN